MADPIKWLLGGENENLGSCDIYVGTHLGFNALDYSTLPPDIIPIQKTGELTFTQPVTWLDVINQQEGVDPSERLQTGFRQSIAGTLNTLPMRLAEIIFPNMVVVRDSTGEAGEVSFARRVGLRQNSKAKFITIVGYDDDGEPAWDNPFQILHVPKAVFMAGDGTSLFSAGALRTLDVTIDFRLSDLRNSLGQRIYSVLDANLIS